jgi:hypothetical protein
MPWTWSPALEDSAFPLALLLLLPSEHCIYVPDLDSSLFSLLGSIKLFIL